MLVFVFFTSKYIDIHTLFNTYIYINIYICIQGRFRLPGWHCIPLGHPPCLAIRAACQWTKGLCVIWGRWDKQLGPTVTACCSLRRRVWWCCSCHPLAIVTVLFRCFCLSRVGCYCLCWLVLLSLLRLWFVLCAARVCFCSLHKWWW